MKVISMVPSWTEMLIECGIEVVGRTRYCVHPASLVRSIPSVGGTKDLNWEKVRGLGADLLILDQEENQAWMKNEAPISVAATHVTSVDCVPVQIEQLNLYLQNEKLAQLAERWRALADLQKKWDWQQIPGEIETLRKSYSEYEKLVYVIWRKPWMRVAQQTFISSVLEKLGAEKYLIDAETKYPTFELADFDSEKTYFLFSSEPFPFLQKKKDLLDLGLQGSIVDGESFSWFGLRSLVFLEKHLVGQSQ